MAEGLGTQGSDVFLASDGVDSDAAREFVRLLQRQRWTVYWERAPQRSDQYLTMIERELRSCRCAVALWSHGSIAGSHYERAAFVLGRGCLVNVRLADCELAEELRDATEVDLIGYPENAARVALQQCLKRIRRFVEATDDAAPFDLGPTLSERVAARVLEGLSKRAADVPAPPPELEFSVGPWRVLPDQNLLVSEGLQVVLQPRAMGVLVELARNAGRTVSKERLLDTVWKDHVVVDAVVHTNIAALRKRLAAIPMDYIETVAKKGYRLVAPVDWSGTSDA